MIRKRCSLTNYVVNSLALYRYSMGSLVGNLICLLCVCYFVCAPMIYLTSQIINVPKKRLPLFGKISVDLEWFKSFKNRSSYREFSIIFLSSSCFHTFDVRTVSLIYTLVFCLWKKKSLNVRNESIPLFFSRESLRNRKVEFYITLLIISCSYSIISWFKAKNELTTYYLICFMWDIQDTQIWLNGLLFAL